MSDLAREFQLGCEYQDDKKINHILNGDGDFLKIEDLVAGFCAVAYAENIRLLNYLINYFEKKGIAELIVNSLDFDQKYFYGTTNSSSKEFIEFFIKYNNDENISIESFLVALMFKGNLNGIKNLIDLGADINKIDIGFLHTAISQDSLNYIENFHLFGGKLNNKEQEGLISKAANTSNIRILIKLLELGYDPLYLGLDDMEMLRDSDPELKGFTGQPDISKLYEALFKAFEDRHRFNYPEKQRAFDHAVELLPESYIFKLNKLKKS